MRFKWNDELIERARELKAKGRSLTAIDKLLGAPKGGTANKLRLLDNPSALRRYKLAQKNWHKRNKPDPQIAAPKVYHFFVPEETWQERDERLAAYKLATLTQVFFGDPPPGFSALDRRAA